MSKKPISLMTVNRLKYSLIFGYAAIVIIAILLVSGPAFNTTRTAMEDNASDLVSALNVQMKLNLNSYLDRMETIATLAFSSEDVYTYDATVSDTDSYEALVKEKEISDVLYNLCIMENFTDYGIVYSNNHTVGKISNGTTGLLGDNIYSDLEAVITRQRTHDGWVAGLHDDYARIYYVKRIHENALFVISFYTAELRNVFDNPEVTGDIDIHLLNKKRNIIYSKDYTEEMGKPLDRDIASLIVNVSDATAIDDKYLVAVNTCGDDWYVICSIPTDIILEDQRRAEKSILIAAIIAAFLAVVLGVVFSVQLTRPVESFVSNLDTKAHTDQLTGLLNKASFEDTVKNRLGVVSEDPKTLILIDLDDFKGVNDTLGHVWGDLVLAHTGKMLKNVFEEEDYIGRIGGDEFAVMINSMPEDNIDYSDYVKSKCAEVCAKHSNYLVGDKRDYKISVSVGCAIINNDKIDFKSLYKAADSALYTSKEGGKNRYTVIDGEV